MESVDTLSVELSRFATNVPEVLPITYETPTSGPLSTASWATAPLKAILTASDSIGHLDERSFLGFLPDVLRTILRFHNAPSIGNLFHSIQYEFQYGARRHSLISHLTEREIVALNLTLSDVHFFAFDCPVEFRVRVIRPS